jgi:hypothetical protein
MGEREKRHQRGRDNYLAFALATVWWTNRFIAMIRWAEINQHPSETAIKHFGGIALVYPRGRKVHMNLQENNASVGWENLLDTRT